MPLDRHTYSIAVHVTPYDNTRYLEKAHHAVIESYHLERDYLLGQIDQLERMVRVLKQKNRSLVEQIAQLDPELNSIERNRNSLSSRFRPGKRPKLEDYNNNNNSNESSTMAPVVKEVVTNGVTMNGGHKIPKLSTRKMTLTCHPSKDVPFRSPSFAPYLQSRKRRMPLLPQPPFLPKRARLPPPPKYYFPFLIHKDPYLM